jgi:hypothetical protein
MPVDKEADNSPHEAIELALFRESDRARERRITDAWSITMQTPQGRAVVWDIITRTGRDTGLARADRDEGQRVLGRHEFGTELYLMVKYTYPRPFLEMLQENLT